MRAEPSTQQTVQAVVPDARVGYVDIDPVVLSHLASLHYQDPAALVVDRDVSDPEAVLRDMAGADRPEPPGLGERPGSGAARSLGGTPEWRGSPADLL